MAVKSFKFPNTYESDQMFKNDLKEIEKLAVKKVNELTANEINRLIYLYERSAISYRRVLENYQGDDKIDMFIKQKIDQNEGPKPEENYPVSISVLEVFDKKIVHLFTPFLFRRGMKESFYLADYLKVFIDKNREKIDFNFAELSEKYIVYVIRVDKEYNFRRHCDNDNLETSELINVIFGFGASVSDNPLRMCFFSDFLESPNEEDWGIHFIVMPSSFNFLHSDEALKLVRDLENND